VDIYEYAMKMERDGEKYYRELVQRTGNAGLKNILTMLADAEVKHYRIFEKMKRNETSETTDTEFLSGVKNIFEKIREGKETSGLSVPEIQMYEQAQDIEKKSEDFYLDKSGEVADSSQKEMLKKIAAEEKRHYNILQSIIDFVSRPEQWLEDAEWYHLEDY
jgi:rubrerythrin